MHCVDYSIVTRNCNIQVLVNHSNTELIKVIAPQNILKKFDYETYMSY